MSARRGLTRLLGGLCAVTVVLGLAQLLLPSIAAKRIASALSRHGTNVHVSISAFPAIKLLFGQADRVDISLGTLTAGNQRADHLIEEMRGVGNLNVTVRRLDEHGLALTDVVLQKRGSAAHASATVSEKSLQNVLPINMTLSSRSLGRSGIALSGRFSVLGHDIHAQVGVGPRDGAIVLYPLVPGLEGLLRGLNVTVFRSPTVRITTVSSHASRGGFRLSATAAFR